MQDDVSLNSTRTNCAPTPEGTRLSTLQMNAIRRMLSRPEFTAQQVASLGVERLRKAEGIGEKGLKNIIAWLHSCGFDIDRAVSSPKNSKLTRLKRAQELLESNGYIVQPLPACHLDRDKAE